MHSPSPFLPQEEHNATPGTRVKMEIWAADQRCIGIIVDAILLPFVH